MNMIPTEILTTTEEVDEFFKSRLSSKDDKTLIDRRSDHYVLVKWRDALLDLEKFGKYPTYKKIINI